MDRSLDEFTTADADEGAADDTGEPTGDAVADSIDADGTVDETATADDPASEDDDEGPSLTVRPAESTMDWTPDGATCAACGATVERRWRDEGHLVCLDCKQW